jgi:hypothetical protein
MSTLRRRPQQFIRDSETHVRAVKLARIAKLAAVKKDPTLILMATARMMRTRRRKGLIR